MQTNGREFVEDRSVRSAAKWKAALHELEERGLAKQSDASGEVFELTHAGFKLSEEIEKKLPLKIEIATHGYAFEHALVIRANKKIKLLRIEFMTTQDIAVSEQTIVEEGDHFVVKIDQPALTKLFNTPRSDSNHYDLSGPMKFALVVEASGAEHTVIVPAQLENNITGNTAYREIIRSTFRTTIK